MFVWSAFVAALLAVAQLSFPSTSFTAPLRPRQRFLWIQLNMQLWLDARSISPAAMHRIDEADTILAISDVPVPSNNTAKPTYVEQDSKLVYDGRVVGVAVNIDSATSQDAALAAVGSVEWILVRFGPKWRMIPAENLIVAAQSAGTKIAAVVERTEDVVGLARALELGVDALSISADCKEDLWNAAVDARAERLDSIQSTSDIVAPHVVNGTCQRLSKTSTVLADRVCVDCVQALQPTEGCWVGSSAKVMALVLSEAATSSYVPSRPFRINAGPVHSYIVLGDGVTTKYLCELEAGESVLVYDCLTGDSRPVAVGRLKIEVRPCVVVGLQSPSPLEDDVPSPKSKSQSPPRLPSSSDAQIFMQQAETVRLGRNGGNSIRVTDLDGSSEKGSKSGKREPVLLRIVGSGTHVGKAYTGKVLER